ncbi:uncharacterized protein [Ptychodera flava]|uniref:uncharacterized protein n=1 Tax=Ptychodera flava TaxID=63121 RepID=UPI003969F951
MLLPTELRRPGGWQMHWAVAAVEEGKFFVTDATMLSEFKCDGEFAWDVPLPGREKPCFPTGICKVPGNKLLITDSANGCLLLYDYGNRRIIGDFGLGHLTEPYDVTVLPNNLVYVVDWSCHDLKVFNGDGILVNTIGGRGSQPGEFEFPWSIACNSRQQLIVADNGNSRIQVLEADGTAVAQFSCIVDGDSQADSGKPRGIAVDDDDVIYVCCGNSVLIFGADGRSWRRADGTVLDEATSWEIIRLGFRISVLALIAFVTSLNGSARFTFFGTRNQSSAKSLCERFGLRLVIDDSVEKHQSLVKAIAEDGVSSFHFWIDAHVTTDENQVKTSDGIELSYKPFAADTSLNENDCVTIVGAAWKSVTCSGNFHHFCENASSSELVFMSARHNTKAHELCQRVGLRLARINGNAQYLEALDTVGGMMRPTERLCWIDAYIDDTSGEVIARDGSVVTYRPRQFYDDGSYPCLSLFFTFGRNDGWRSVSCIQKNNVLCEETGNIHDELTVSASPYHTTGAESLKISQSIDEINRYVLQLSAENFTLNASIILAQGTLNKIQDITDAVLSNASEGIDVELKRHYTETLATIYDNLAEVLFSKMTSGGTVVLKTPSLVLNLEKNTIQDLTNCTIMVGPHTGVQIPSVEHIFHIYVGA